MDAAPSAQPQVMIMEPAPQMMTPEVFNMAVPTPASDMVQSPMSMTTSPEVVNMVFPTPAVAVAPSPMAMSMSPMGSPVTLTQGPSPSA